MRKPLYLDSTKVKAVKLDAVALKVELHEQADQFFPLRLISRVVVTGKIEWETQALLACLDYGVPVSFRRRDGRLLGHCLSDRSSQVPLEQLLTACADSTEGDALYQQWRVHEESRWMQRMGKALRQPLNGNVAHSVLKQVGEALSPMLPCTFGLFTEQLRVPIANHVAGILGAYGFSDNVHLPLTQRVHLSRDVEKLVLLEVYWLVARGEVVHPYPDKGLRYAIITFYERHHEATEERARIALNRLWRLLKHQEAD